MYVYAYMVYVIIVFVGSNTIYILWGDDRVVTYTQGGCQINAGVHYYNPLSQKSISFSERNCKYNSTLCHRSEALCALSWCCLRALLYSGNQHQNLLQKSARLIVVKR